MPVLALVDWNNFYASCERVFQPGLRGRPVVVLSNNDGCVIARSNEAKALGVEMGAPWHLHKERFARAGIIVRLLTGCRRMKSFISSKILFRSTRRSSSSRIRPHRS